MPESAELHPITGDVAATADVTINTKGGSTTATLRKALRDRLGRLGDQMAGAAVEFATGQALVLLSGGSGAADAAPVRVRKIGRNRFEIELEVEEDEEVDEVTAAFLRLKKDQFERGLLNLSAPMTADALEARMKKRFAAIDSVIEEPTIKVD